MNSLSAILLFVLPSAGEDYLLLDREVEARIDTNRGGMSVCIQLQIISDEQPEPSEFFSVEFRAPSSETLVASCTVEIIDGKIHVFVFVYYCIWFTVAVQHLLLRHNSQRVITRQYTRMLLVSVFYSGVA